MVAVRVGLSALCIGLAVAVCLKVTSTGISDYKLQPADDAQPPSDMPAPVRTSGNTFRRSQRAEDRSCASRCRVQYVADFHLFVEATLDALNASHHFGVRPMVHFTDHAASYLARAPRDGLILEFGVFQGDSLRRIATSVLASGFRGTIAGFDSFEGLPEAWTSKMGKRYFDQKGLHGKARQRVPPSVLLVKGWFQDTLPVFLAEHPRVAATLLHIDGDLFMSAIVPLDLLSDRITVGTLLLFDELLGYNEYRQHEILALYLWLKHSGAVLCAVGMREPIFTTDFPKEVPSQSALFRVIEVPQPLHVGVRPNEEMREVK